MQRRPIRRAAVLALAMALGWTSIASADALFGDGDTVTAGRQATVELGAVAPGASITVQVRFELVCSGSSHPDVGQSVVLTPMTPSLPAGSGVVSFASATVGPIPESWPADGALCPSPLPVLSSEPVSVTFTAPTTINSGYVATFPWRRALTPTGNEDATALTGSATGVSFFFVVVANTPPSLTLPADLLVEGDTTGGWVAAFDVTANDVEDDPDPAATCDPAPGTVLPLGTTTVTCSVTDSGGLSDADGFEVTVVDTTAPALAAVSSIEVDATGSDGAVVPFDVPSAVDVVDPSPGVACSPAAGSLFPVGVTTVTCTATDASGNEASTAFEVTVTAAPAVVEATWLEPVGVADGGTFVTNRGRTRPVKVILTVDGVGRTTGEAALRLRSCSGADAGTVPLVFGGGRWNAAIDTGRLPADCVLVTAAIDGLDAGSFRLETRGAEATSTRGRGR
jgi:hypothetical protein